MHKKSQNKQRLKKAIAKKLDQIEKKTIAFLNSTQKTDSETVKTSLISEK